MAGDYSCRAKLRTPGERFRKPDAVGRARAAFGGVSKNCLAKFDPNERKKFAPIRNLHLFVIL